jgi:Na+/H+-translocating membrane pyrophosphatase
VLLHRLWWALLAAQTAGGGPDSPVGAILYRAQSRLTSGIELVSVRSDDVRTADGCAHRHEPKALACWQSAVGAITGMLVRRPGAFSASAEVLRFPCAVRNSAPRNLYEDRWTSSCNRAARRPRFGGLADLVFARLGGGIFTKGAGRRRRPRWQGRAGIPEDDPRNPAIATTSATTSATCAGIGRPTAFEILRVITLVGTMVLARAAAPSRTAERPPFTSSRRALGVAGRSSRRSSAGFFRRKATRGRKIMNAAHISRG